MDTTTILSSVEGVQYLSDEDGGDAFTGGATSNPCSQMSGSGTQPSELTPKGSTQRAMWEPTQMISGTIELATSNWGRLVPSDMKTDSQGNAKNWTSKDLEKSKLFVGRIKERLELQVEKDLENNDMLVVEDPVVSSFHCIIERDEEENVWLTDKSTNGTYVNKTKVGRGKRRLISDGDEIVLVTCAKRDRKTKKPRKKLSFFFYTTNCEDDELSAVKRTYHFKDQLGVGSFAEVWLGIHRMEGTKVAIKKIDLKRYRAMLVGPDALQNEIDVMNLLSHDNIIRLEEHQYEGNFLYLIMEYAPHGDLAKVIFEAHKKSGTPLQEAGIFDMFSQLLEAVSHVHSKGLIHRDLKPDNVLVSSLDPIVLKLTDFGLARNAKGATSAVGSHIYSAPEVFEGDYGKPVDFWSLGCILYALFNGNPPFIDAEGRRPFREQQRGGVKFGKKKWHNVSKYVRDLICRLCLLNPKKRITEEKIRGHKWYKQFHRKRKLPDEFNKPKPKRQNTGEEMGSLLDNITIGSPNQSTQLTSQASIFASDTSNSSVSSADFVVPKPRKKLRRS